MRLYHLQMAHSLDEVDYAARVELARSELSRLEADPDRLNNMFFSDEAHFHLCGGVNRQNWILWADENPHWFDVCRLHPEKVNVWMGIDSEGVIGPYFWELQGSEKGINARWMRSLLDDQVIPSLRQWSN